MEKVEVDSLILQLTSKGPSILIPRKVYFKFGIRDYWKWENKGSYVSLHRKSVNLFKIEFLKNLDYHSYPNNKDWREKEKRNLRKCKKKRKRKERKKRKKESHFLFRKWFPCTLPPGEIWRVIHFWCWLPKDSKMKGRISKVKRKRNERKGRRVRSGKNERWTFDLVCVTSTERAYLMGLCWQKGAPGARLSSSYQKYYDRWMANAGPLCDNNALISLA